MKELTKKNNQTMWVPSNSQRNICIFIIYIFIIIFYYYTCMYTYNLYNNDNCELISVCTIGIEELKSVSQPNIWYKSILDDFFNKFTSSSKTINLKYLEIKSDCVLKTLMPLEQNLETVEKSIILNKIQSDYIKTLIYECEYYKSKTSSLEAQLLNTKIAYQDLIKDINDIVKEMDGLIRKS